ncbi:hypothetical protein GWI33_022827 [Rhynchophorus ferrugineus]|uniref:ribonuclease III n=1 Tax=Rhynchophorus ferrugineus TaxID=354439 RepID=A0A834IMR5_RHYFE|nr:hypothetical protein GWI33_022827 [Rhynchophorus ferrugineus]
MSAESDFKPRDYQVALREIAIKKNTIIYLPTGSGKTYIAVLLLKHFTEPITRCYSQNGKISFVLVNSVPLVNQHAKCIEKRTMLKVGQYSGDMNLDNWSKGKWHEEFDKYNVFVMTVQILVNLTNQNFIDLNKVNLIVFDECHRAVEDQPMRQLCKSFVHLREQPRILGLTATLLNGNCSPTKVMDQVKNLEITFHSQVATVDGIEQVSAYSTNPTEKILIVHQHVKTSIEDVALFELQDLITTLSDIKDITEIKNSSLIPLHKKEEFQKLSNVIKDVIFHIETTGIFGGSKAILARMIHIERLKKHCSNVKLQLALSYVGTILGYLKKLFDKHMQDYSEKDKVTYFSSDKVLKLIKILDVYQKETRQNHEVQELCAIIFTKRRFTAKVLYYILDHLSKHDKNYSYIKSNFMVGYNSNPYNDTRELLYTVKKNRSILQSFNNKEINTLVASNVLEEGMDISSCSLVIKYDHPEDYRSYIQSKGRARSAVSLYYLLVEENVVNKFKKKYEEFQAIENKLQNLLFAKNMEREGPSESDINNMYHEDPLPPYYVNGPNSAKVDMTSAISLLCTYCNSLSQDVELAPELYLEFNNNSFEKKVRVVIDLPTICPLTESIIGPFMSNTKLAKRAAALRACVKLHQIKELDDNLLPKKRAFAEEDFRDLFLHYPKLKEPLAGTNKCVREHKNEVPTFLQGPFIANGKAYLHILYLTPDFFRRNELIQSTFYDMYTSDLCYGFITPHEIPSICLFPLYISTGTLNVSLMANANTVNLTPDDFHKIKQFNVMVLRDVLISLRDFLICGSGPDTEAMMFVPVNKSTNTINYTILRGNNKIKPPYQEELSRDEKLNLNVTQESHLRKIVSPWYRDIGEFLVVEVSFTKNAKSMFPNDSFQSYEEYYEKKHNLQLVNPSQPLLLVKQLTKNRNFFKPYGSGAAKRKEKHSDMEIHLIPELVVKQDFPAELWIQASLLPSIISRLSFLFRLEVFRQKVALEVGLGKRIVVHKKPLELNKNLLHYKPLINETNKSNILMPISKEACIQPPLTTYNLNRNYAKRMLEIEYPWKDTEEPKDIERELNVSILDIDYYESFISKPITPTETLLKNEISIKRNQLALTYMKDNVDKSIKLLESRYNEDGPELCEIYEAMTTVKSNDIVNMERLETLGDSFLKMFASIYIYLKYPQFTAGSATSLKGRLVSNKNLYYLGKLKNIGGIMKTRDLQISDWLPTGFKVPDEIENAIKSKQLPVSLLYRLNFSTETQVSGVLSQEDFDNIEALQDPDDDVESINDSAPFFNVSFTGDKRVADCVEALIGVYFKCNGIQGGIQFMEWMNIIPAHENLYKLINQRPPNPILKQNATEKDVMYHIPRCSDIENIIGYKFNNPAYLLQALTHGSYTPNRITQSYERLEFLGDAILDFLITCYIYENSDKLNPGELTDLRSALVNNNTFASLVVRLNLHKYMLCINNKLQSMIDRFAEYMLSKNYEIDDEVLILLEEGDADGKGHNLAEYIDVPKVLGDIFEAVAGAIFLDSNNNLDVVWKIFYRIMSKEIESFTANVPKNLVRKLYEWTPDPHPTFMEAKEVVSGTVMVPLQFVLNGRHREVYGFGSNKTNAKKAAAKLALRQLK